ncbi:hypothetical protein J7643_18630 [bacterium]|nr:hypothetical protein [bacterium]
MNVEVRFDATAQTGPIRSQTGSLNGAEPLQPAIAEATAQLSSRPDTSSVTGGLKTLQAFARPGAAKTVAITTLSPAEGKRLVNEAVNLAYMAANLGVPGSAKAYLDTTLNAIKFYNEHFPNDPEKANYARLAVDIAVWMKWDAKTATAEERAGLLAAAEVTKAHPKPDYYVTMEDPTLVEVFHKPVPYSALNWLPTWLFKMLPEWFLRSFGDSRLCGKPVRHPVDHRARAEGLIKQIKDAL